MPRSIRAALAQVNTTVGDLEGNSQIIHEKIREARKQQADIVTFPELCLCGYPPEDLLLKQGFAEDSMKALDKIAAGTPSGIVAAVGCVYGRAPDRLYNSCALIHEGRIRAVYRKAELPNYGVFDEKRYFREGGEPFIFTINGVAAGVNICEDIWLPGAAEAQAGAGAEIIFNISSSPFHTGKGKMRLDVIGDKAKKLNIFICYNNSVGGQDELVFDGGSFVVDGGGNGIADAERFRESLLVCDINPGDNAPPAKSRFSFKTPRAPRTALTAHRTTEAPSDTEQIYEALVLAAADYAGKNGFKKAVIGISGGIDSALTAAVAKDALGAENTVGVLMPSRFSSRETVEDSRQLAELLDMALMEISIEPIFEAYLQSLKQNFKREPPGPAEENIQARIRGNLLMALSNKFGWLVLATGNKSELSCGYCTLYGDMAGGFSVLKDIYKTTVYKLAEFRNSKGPAIPESIIKKAPTAELKHNQTDQDTLPPYDVLDAILREYIENNKNLGQLKKMKRFEPETLKKVVSMVDASEYKRRQAPPGVKITPRALGRDRRMPITNHYRL